MATLSKGPILLGCPQASPRPAKEPRSWLDQGKGLGRGHVPPPSPPLLSPPSGPASQHGASCPSFFFLFFLSLFILEIPPRVLPQALFPQRAARPTGCVSPQRSPSPAVSRRTPTCRDKEPGTLVRGRPRAPARLPARPQPRRAVCVCLVRDFVCFQSLRAKKGCPGGLVPAPGRLHRGTGGRRKAQPFRASFGERKEKRRL